MDFELLALFIIKILNCKSILINLYVITNISFLFVKELIYSESLIIPTFLPQE